MPVVDASLPVQKAIVAALKADPAVNAIVAGRIYDGVPLSAVKPYVSFGPFQLLPEQADCLEGAEIVVQLDGWAAGPDTVQVKQLGAAMAAALDGAPLTLDGNRLVLFEVETTQYLREPDNITAHAVLTLRAMTEPV